MRPRNFDSQVLEGMNQEQLTELLASVKQEINRRHEGEAAYHGDLIRQAIQNAIDNGLTVCFDTIELEPDDIYIVYESEE